MFDPRPLCCSSLTTAVGGTKYTNIVDSESPYRGTNQLLGDQRTPGFCGVTVSILFMTVGRREGTTAMVDEDSSAIEMAQAGLSNHDGR